MIAVGIRFLTKYSVSTNASTQGPEWPPHPGRVFMAMVAAHFETGGEARERQALEWLEALEAPFIRASQGFERSAIRTYVPVNDEHGGIVQRARQDRPFACIRPHDDCVLLIWNAEVNEHLRDALDSVCRKVTRIGHSSSAVQMWVTTDHEMLEPNWIPAAEGDERMRVASKGTLRSLEEAFNRENIEAYDRTAERIATAKGKEKARLQQELHSRFGNTRPESRRPLLTQWQGYSHQTEKKQDSIIQGPFERDFVILTKREGAALGLEASLPLTRALRNAAMKACGRPPEWLSGHDAEEAPSRYPHAAFFPLPHVGAEFADGHVLGLGLAIPRDLRLPSGSNQDEALRSALGPLLFDKQTGKARYVALWSDCWRWELERETRERPPLGLRRDTWTLPSRKWASVTPVVLHHYPKKNRDGDIERIVHDAFETAGFPAPIGLEIGPVSFFEGAGHAMNVPQFSEGGAALCRYQTHVVAFFNRRVEGPMLIGRGRYRGYGLMRPVQEGATDE